MAAETSTAMTAEVQQPAPAPRFFGETYGFWCQTTVLLAAAILAYVAIRTNRNIERRKAAIEAIFASKRDTALVQAHRHIAALAEQDVNMAAHGRKTNIDSEHSKIIRYALNHYEYVSVGISRGIYDEDIFKDSTYTTIVNLYERTKPFIDMVRVEWKTPTSYQELECLVCRWKEKPLKHKPIKAVEA